MSLHVPSRVRAYILLAISALVVAYVRTKLQYGRSGWESGQALVISWSIHYVALGIMAALCSVLINLWSDYIFPDDEHHQELSVDRGVFHVAVIAMVTAIAILLLAYNVPADTYGF